MVLNWIALVVLAVGGMGTAQAEESNSQRFFRFSSTPFAVEWDEVFEVGIGPVYVEHYTQETEIWDFGLLKEAHIGGQTIIRDLATSVEQTSWGQVKMSFGGRLRFSLYVSRRPIKAVNRGFKRLEIAPRHSFPAYPHLRKCPRPQRALPQYGLGFLLRPAALLGRPSTRARYLDRPGR